jgi:hypothetical protein
MRKDIAKLIKTTKGYLKEIEDLKNTPDDQIGKSVKNNKIQDKKQKLNKIVDDKFNNLKKFNQERKDVAQSKLNDLYSGDDQARQRFQNEVRNDLSGVDDIDKIMEYYNSTKEKESQIKQQEARKVIKNKLWKEGDEVQLHNFKKEIVNDLSDEELKQVRQITESQVMDQEINELESHFKSFIVNDAVNNGKIDKETEKALIQSYGNKDKLNKKIDSKIVDNV